MSIMYGRVRFRVPELSCSHIADRTNGHSDITQPALAEQKLILVHLRKQIIAYWRTGDGLAAAERQPTAARQLSHVYCKVGCVL